MDVQVVTRIGERRGAFSQRLGRFRRGLRSPVVDGIAIVAVAVIILVAIVGPFVAPDVYTSRISDALQAPSSTHWFGTDQQGRDVFWRVIVGTRTSLTTALVVVIGYAVIGVVIGTLCAIGPRFTREIFLRLVDVGLSVPGIVVALGIAAALGASIQTAAIALILTGWPMTARILSGLVAETRTQGYVEGALVLGASRWRVLRRHVLPNSMPVLWVKWTGDIGMTILGVGGLSFIGAGAQPPSAEWGAMVGSDSSLFATAWWAAAFPGIAIVIASAAFSLLGDLLHVRINPELELSNVGRKA